MDELTKIILAVVIMLASLAALFALIGSAFASLWEALDRFNNRDKMQPGSPEADTDEWENDPRKGE